MDVVFENKVDAAISRFLGCVGAVPVAFIGTFEFANGLRACWLIGMGQQVLLALLLLSSCLRFLFFLFVGERIG